MTRDSAVMVGLLIAGAFAAGLEVGARQEPAVQVVAAECGEQPGHRLVSKTVYDQATTCTYMHAPMGRVLVRKQLTKEKT